MLFDAAAAAVAAATAPAEREPLTAAGWKGLAITGAELLADAFDTLALSPDLSLEPSLDLWPEAEAIDMSAA